MGGAAAKAADFVGCKSRYRQLPADMALAGMAIDTARHADVVALWQGEQHRAQAALVDLVGAETKLTPRGLSNWLRQNAPQDVLATWPETRGRKDKNSGQRVDQQLKLDQASLTDIPMPGPFIPAFLDWKFWDKRLCSFGPKWAARYIDPQTGRIHANYLIHGAHSGRYACTKPNLQQLPRADKREGAAAIRNAFVAPPGRVLVVADYSQIELRVLAYIAQEQAMLEAYHKGVDLHKLTASKVHRIGIDAVSKAQRQAAKAANFGIIYGISPAGLALQLRQQGIDADRQNTQALITGYHEAYPAIRAHQLRQEAAIESDGVVWTYGVRRIDYRRQINRLIARWGNFRSIPYGGQYSDNDGKLTTQGALFRSAYNVTVSGTAADCMYVSLALLRQRLREQSLDATLIQVVHDEVIVECAESCAGQVKTLVEASMVDAFLQILSAGPTHKLVEANIGRTWYEAR